MMARIYPRFLLPLGLLILAGCGPSGSSRSQQGHALPASHLVADCEPGRTGGKFVLASSGMPSTFNPLLVADDASDNVIRLLFSSLVTLDPKDGVAKPALAESWSVAADQKTWTFKLRLGVRWSDGHFLTADDVVFTWYNIMYNPNFNRMTYDLFRINGKEFSVTRTDDQTVVVVTPEVFAPFLEFFGTVPILPKHVLETLTKNHAFSSVYSTNSPVSLLVGSGPYRVKEVNHGKWTLLERNPEYWVADREGHRLPYFDEVMFLPVNGQVGEEDLFLAGKSDACDAINPEDYSKFKQAEGTRFKTLDVGPGSERDFLWFNLNTGATPSGLPIVNPAKLKWFRDKHFRQAISCSIDRARIVREVYHGRAQAATGFVSGESPRWNNPNVPQYNFDPARAKALFAEAGLQDRNGDGVLEDAEGHPVEFSLISNAGNPLRERAALQIQDDFKKAGIRMGLDKVDFRVLVERINQSFNYEAALMGLGGGSPEPASQVNVLRSSEELHQWFPLQRSPSTPWEGRIDALMDAQMRTLDYAQRKKDYDEVQAILAEELPLIYTVTPFWGAAVRNDVGNVRPSSMMRHRVTWNLEELYFKK